MIISRFTKPLRAALALLVLLAAPATAQVATTDLFKTAVKINGKGVTNYEVQQRMIMLRLFRTAGDIEKQALEGLIEDRLRFQAAEQMGLTLTEKEIEAGEAEFASRANLSREAFIRNLAQAGVARESFRDFAAAGLLWRQVVRDRFAQRAQAQVNESDIQRAISTTSRRGGGVKADFAEIILPANTPEAAAEAQRRAAEITGAPLSEAAFSSYARRFSASPSRERGGRVPEPVPIGNLPAPIAQAFLTLPPGGVTEPFPIPNAVAIFQLRRLIDSNDPGEGTVALEYARFLIPGGRTEATLAEAAKIRKRVDSCDDLYKVAQGLPPQRLTRETRAPADVPGDIALELARLDQGESSTALTAGNALVFLMLCGRTTATLADPNAPRSPDAAPAGNAAGDQALAEADTPAPENTTVEGVPEVDRRTVRERLVNQVAAGYASSYLAELKANAIITYP